MEHEGRVITISLTALASAKATLPRQVTQPILQKDEKTNIQGIDFDGEMIRREQSIKGLNI